MRIGEDIREKLDYAPGVFTLEGHIGGKWYAASATAVRASCALPPAKTRVSAGGLLRFAQLNRQDPHAISRTSSRACPRGPAHRRIIAPHRWQPEASQRLPRPSRDHWSLMTLVVKLRAPCRSAEGKRKPWNNFDPQAIVKLDRRVKGARSRKVL
ncbi:hypothetical protein F6X39_05770 [Paraburkholderia sp. UCT2]|nr:hypothetical protein [Paraburkholderia sp. UCT2]